MQFSTKTILALSLMSTDVVHGHGRLKNPDASQIDGFNDYCTTTSCEKDHYGDHWYTQGTNIGCKEATGENCPPGGSCCDTIMEPTLSDISQLTYRYFNGFGNTTQKRQLRGVAGTDNDDKQQEQRLSVTNSPLKANPWFAPGHAPISDVCGILGGWAFNNAQDYMANNIFMPPVDMSIPAGTLGTAVLLRDLNTKMMNAQGSNYLTNTNSVWKSGDVQEVSYTVAANHGGGIQYRICPLDKLLNNTISEDCFEALEFVGDKSWFQYTDENSEPKSIPFTAVRVSDTNTAGVLPNGSTWTQVGLPACADDGTSFGLNTNMACDEPMFQNGTCSFFTIYKTLNCNKAFLLLCHTLHRIATHGFVSSQFDFVFLELTDAGFWGFGKTFLGGNSKELQNLIDSQGENSFSIVDQVKVPEGHTGDFVFQWRWDCEQTPQVWTQCAVVTIEE